MRHSRYLWFLLISIGCIVVMSALKTPQAVVSAMTQPQFADSPRVAVQRFWNCLDTRQLDLAEKFLVRTEMTPLGKHEVENWEDLVERNPLISLQKLEFLSSSSPQSLMIRVSWASPLDEKVSATYSVETQSTPDGWKISQIQKIISQSLANQ